MTPITDLTRFHLACLDAYLERTGQDVDKLFGPDAKPFAQAKMLASWRLSDGDLVGIHRALDCTPSAAVISRMQRIGAPVTAWYASILGASMAYVVALLDKPREAWVMADIAMANGWQWSDVRFMSEKIMEGGPSGQLTVPMLKDRIQAVLCERYSVEWESVLSVSRKPAVVWCRQVATAIMHQLVGWSYTDIGMWLRPLRPNHTGPLTGQQHLAIALKMGHTMLLPQCLDVKVREELDAITSLVTARSRWENWRVEVPQFKKYRYPNQAQRGAA